MRERSGPSNFASGIAKRVGFIISRSSTHMFKQGIYEVVTQVQKFLSRIPEFFFLDLVVPGCTDQT
jgi:hypothetical protein